MYTAPARCFICKSIYGADQQEGCEMGYFSVTARPSMFYSFYTTAISKNLKDFLINKKQMTHIAVYLIIAAFGVVKLPEDSQIMLSLVITATT